MGCNWNSVSGKFIPLKYEILKKKRKPMIIKASVSRKMENNGELNLTYKGKNNKYKNKNQWK